MPFLQALAIPTLKYLSLFLGLMFAVPLQNAGAQVIDTLAPVIEFEELKEAQADLAQVFTVQIADNSQLQDATLYHRRAGQQPYIATPLNPLGTSGYYTASIETDPTDLRSIEYYIQARDVTGNRTVSGFAFDPYQRALLATNSESQGVLQTPAEVAEPSMQTSSWLDKTWVRVTLGVLAAGFLMTALDDGGNDRQVVPVTINLQ